MKCPFCRVDNDRVIDSRSSQDGLAIRRRRECVSCSRRFTTYERPEETTIKVIKKDGSRVPFEREKIKRGLERACWKRPITQPADRDHDHRDRERRLPAVRERSGEPRAGRAGDALSARPRRSGVRAVRQRLSAVQRRVRFLRRAAADAGGRKPAPAAAVKRPFLCGGQFGRRPLKLAVSPSSAEPKVRPTHTWGGSSVGRALRSQCRGRGFDSLPLHSTRCARSWQAMLRAGVAAECGMPMICESNVLRFGRAAELVEGPGRALRIHTAVSDGSYYVGSTQNVAERIKVHNSGQGPTFTARRLPVRLIYQEPFADPGRSRPP